MRIYLDTNVVCRPFDDHSKERVSKEATAISRLIIYVGSRMFDVIVSDVVLAELSLIQNTIKRELIELYVTSIALERVEVGENEIKIADLLQEKCKIKDYMDTLHIASAVTGNCKYFVTCDDELIDKAWLIKNELIKLGYELEIVNPLDLLEEG